MNDPQLAAALRSRSPDALPELLDAYGDQLFSYCWRLLRNRENAQIAMRDALVVATAHIERLFCDEWLGLWLYSLARAECLRREAVPAADADEPVALPGTDDADSRLTAWKAVTSMPADEVEALELDARHDVDLRLVLGLSAAEVQALLDRARRDLERALGAEILIRKSHACPDGAALLSGWTGATTPALRDRMLEHAATCSVCGPNLPRSVSATRVFALLPAPVLSSVARLEVLGFFDDSRKAAYREFTVSRAEELTGSWFLSTPEPPEPATGSWFIPTPKPADPTPSEPTHLAHLPEPDPVSPAPDLAPEPALTSAAAATGLVSPGPVVAQGFMGSWPSLADPADPKPGPKPGPPTEPIPSAPGLAPRPAVSRPASPPAPTGPQLTSGPQPARGPQPASGPQLAHGPQPARGPQRASGPQPAGSGPVAPEPLAPVIPLPAPPPAVQAGPRPSRPAATPAPGARPVRRRPRVSRIGVATAASVAVTAVFVLVGFHVTPSASTASSVPSVAAEGPGSAAAQPGGGGADAARPVKVRRSSGAPSSAEPRQQSAVTKTESLAVAAASQPGTSSPSLPGQAGRPASSSSASASASASASSSAPSADGTLAVTPDRLDLGRATTGLLTLTARNGPVSWSADTSSSLVTLNSQQGTLQAGQSVTLAVSVTPGRGDEFVFVYSSPLTSGATGAPSAAPSASQAVEITWATGRPGGPRPSPSPSDSSSPSPSPSASAAPSSDLGGS
jgi:DNA-directed RNA polymerase specialized sigma24 family protein